MSKIRLLNYLYEGPDAPITQRFANKLILNGVDVYAQYNLKGHNGIDFALVTGTILVSCITGTVIEAENDPAGYGNYIKIENDYCGVLYAHMDSFTVGVGDKVKAGDIIGKSDNTGNSTGPHLHFGVFPKPRDRANGYAGYIDPFNNSLVEWVESLDDPITDVEDLKKELANMQVRLDTANTELRDLQKKVLIKDSKLREVAKDLEQVIQG
jgi:murein DD-endopeptidase MepM/ murein hydrolase activator NlpD